MAVIPIAVPPVARRSVPHWLIVALALGVALAVSLLAASGTENFNCADSDSPDCNVNWTEAGGGDVDISSNTACSGAASFAASFAGADTALGSADQYFKFTITNVIGGVYHALVFRYTNSSSPAYMVRFYGNEDEVHWERIADPSDASPSTIGSSALVIASGDTFGATVTGTGTSTIVRIWKNPTGVPATADDWNGDNTPDVSLTNDPATPVNTGNSVGFVMYTASALDACVDDLAWGDFVAAGGGPPAGSLGLLGVGK